MFWSNPFDFNDPFDCNPVISKISSRAEKLEIGKKLYSRYDKSSNRAQRRASLSRSRFTKSRSFSSLTNNAFKNSLNSTAVLCLSKVHNCPLMWSHYGNSHRGYCLEFEELFEPYSFFGFDVRYSDERPTLTLPAYEQVDQLINVVLTKSRIWEYENERRMIDTQNGAGERAFPPHALTGIFLGAKITGEDREFVESLCRRKPTGLPIKLMKLNPTQYILDDEPAFT